MARLSSNWFVEGLQDFEYKKYLLLAYLKWVKERFDDARLYPEFADLIRHYNNLIAFHKDQSRLRGLFPKQVSGIDTEKLEMIYDSMIDDDEVMREIGEIVAYALPKVKGHLEEGRELYEFIDDCIEIDAVGVLPLSKEEGYFLLRGGEEEEVSAYAFKTTIFESANEKFRGIHTKFLSRFRYSLTNTYETIKLELVRRNKRMPNPATFLIYSRLKFPENESFVPVAKRKLMRFLATEVA